MENSKMTLEELQDRYPQCPNAIEFVEQPDVEFALQIHRQLNHSVEEVLTMMKESGENFVKEKEAQNELESASDARNTLGEMDLPQFRVYLAGKLGSF